MAQTLLGLSNLVFLSEFFNCEVKLTPRYARAIAGITTTFKKIARPGKMLTFAKAKPNCHDS